MKLLLLQDEIYLPSLGGGVKANRLLLEALARRGHDVAAVAPALTRSATGPHSSAEFFQTMVRQGIATRVSEENVYAYAHNGVRVDALDPAVDVREHIRRRIDEFQPDAVIVNDDKRRVLLETALRSAPDRVFSLLQTIIQLPFGPLAVQQDPNHAQLLSQAQSILVISQFMQNYIREYSRLASQVIHLPVYGDGPFPMLARFERGFVTMINPCDLKGLPVFLALARMLPGVEFAAVPTWGTDDAAITALRSMPNVRLLEPSEDIDEIFSQTRILLVPSLWPETFGYVVPEAMLRGIPVLASDIGGLPEAKLGVDYLLPIVPAQHGKGGYFFPPQDAAPWAQTLQLLLHDRATYDRVSQQSRDAATQFVAQINASDFERHLMQRGTCHALG